jgi:hypothetical protein
MSFINLSGSDGLDAAEVYAALWALTDALFFSDDLAAEAQAPHQPSQVQMLTAASGVPAREPEISSAPNLVWTSLLRIRWKQLLAIPLVSLAQKFGCSVGSPPEAPTFDNQPQTRPQLLLMLLHLSLLPPLSVVLISL